MRCREIASRRLEWKRGTVSGRVAELLRFAEVNPSFKRFFVVRRRWVFSWGGNGHAFGNGHCGLEGELVWGGGRWVSHRVMATLR